MQCNAFKFSTAPLNKSPTHGPGNMYKEQWLELISLIVQELLNIMNIINVYILDKDSLRLIYAIRITTTLSSANKANCSTKLKRNRWYT